MPGVGQKATQEVAEPREPRLLQRNLTKEGVRLLPTSAPQDPNCSTQYPKIGKSHWDALWAEFDHVEALTQRHL